MFPDVSFRKVIMLFLWKVSRINAKIERLDGAGPKIIKLKLKHLIGCNGLNCISDTRR
jgi:hypothetical protein